MKIVAYSALHYGVSYFGVAIRSVIDHVDELVVLYAAQGSHGHRTSIPCPETRDELYAIASQAAGMKLRWIDGDWTNEGAQRMSIHQHAPDADILIVLDADEIFNLNVLHEAFGPKRLTARAWRVPMVHFWRSFHKAIIDDKAFPVRVVYPKVKSGEGVMDCAPIAHLGYAQPLEIVEYKQYTHGHKGEWRKDINWFKDRYLANAQADCHPVSVNYWLPVTVNPMEYMPEFMKEHPYYGQEVIE